MRIAYTALEHELPRRERSPADLLHRRSDVRHDAIDEGARRLELFDRRVVEPGADDRFLVRKKRRGHLHQAVMQRPELGRVLVVHVVRRIGRRVALEDAYELNPSRLAAKRDVESSPRGLRRGSQLHHRLDRIDRELREVEPVESLPSDLRLFADPPGLFRRLHLEALHDALDAEHLGEGRGCRNVQRSNPVEAVGRVGVELALIVPIRRDRQMKHARFVGQLVLEQQRREGLRARFALTGDLLGGARILAGDLRAGLLDLEADHLYGPLMDAHGASTG